MLEVYPNAPLRDVMARSRWSLAPEDDVVAMYLSCFDRMDTAGYVQYEVSSAARPGRESRHNLKYWSDGEWLGLGCGAHSTRGGVRWKNVSATGEYIERVTSGRPATCEERRLSEAERIEDALFMGLRRTAGLDLAAFRRQYGTDVWATYGPELQPFVDTQLLIYDGRSVRMTRSGMLLAHEIMTVFIRAAVR
jgi:oxygen-independent coproporphyrinogen-3 oxidase